MTDNQIQSILRIKDLFIEEHKYSENQIHFSNPLYSQENALDKAHIKRLIIELEMKHCPQKFSKITHENLDEKLI